MILFEEIDPIRFKDIATSFSKEDFRIFPLSRRPKYHVMIHKLYRIIHKEFVVGYIYTMKKGIIIQQVFAHELCLIILEKNRATGIGKQALFQFMKEKGASFFTFSKRNIAMSKIAADESKFTKTIDMTGKPIYHLKNE